MINFTSICNVKKLLTSAIALSTLLVTPTGAMAADLTTPKAPFLLTQQMNGRIATLQCGGYGITIRFVGSASSNTFSYQTKGLFLRNGIQEGDDYIFYNSDYEYRVTTTSGGTGRLEVSHYGERILTKQCTWS